jgi:NAD(P)-dependent dehydrogenase (short-subunit alcohol dehydrogenase family)
MSSLQARVAVVTGGAGALGSAVVRAFLGAGARVVVPYRKEGELESLRARLGAGADAPLSGSAVDLTSEEEVAAFFERARSEAGSVNALVNAAGSFSGGAAAHETAWATWQAMLDVNLKTAVLASQAAARQMATRGGGAIVNVSARAALGSGEKISAYAASKRALLQLTEAMAAELKPSGVTVNAVLPSTIDTPANRKAMPDADFSTWTKPEEIARVILFLAGPDARIVTGAQIPV